MYEYVSCSVEITGLVQGLGFRPYVAGLAEELGLCGWVRNSGGIVTAEICGNIKAVEEWFHRLKSMPPRGARIDDIKIIEKKDFEKSIILNGSKAGLKSGFEIIHSDNDNETVYIAPDLATCDSCYAELEDSSNRRFRYPFISCTACGPRYSIIDRNPYDRINTRMSVFKMCDSCRKEYAKPGDIRRHAQTIACYSCGPELQLYINEAGKVRRVSFDDISGYIDKSIEYIRAGKIGAIKDIGGYHFACLPESETALRLREYKNRENKPFAIMFPDMETIKEYCVVSEKEEELLCSTARPIVLLNRKNDFAKEVCAASDRIGAFLPCNPIQYMICKETGPLIMTSGNRGGEPIITENNIMIDCVTDGFPDFVLSHDRDIIEPLEDSIYQVTKLDHEGITAVGSETAHDNVVFEGNEAIYDSITSESSKVSRKSMASESGKASCDSTVLDSIMVSEEIEPTYDIVTSEDCTEDAVVTQLIRRARGLVPEPIRISERTDKDIFAAGGDLKSVFAYCRGDYVYPGTYYGDMEDSYSLDKYNYARERMSSLFGFKPEIIVADMHPEYYSAKNVKSFASESDRVIRVQHHHAHIASVIAEHALKGNVLGLAFDGTGMGDDGSIWGGEFLLCEEDSYTRVGSLLPVSMPSSDNTAKDAFVPAFCYMYRAYKEGYLSKEEFEEFKSFETVKGNRENNKSDILAKALDNNFRVIGNSSMGRLFDAASYICGICDFNSYEGECAIRLENDAKKSLEADELLSKKQNINKHTINYQITKNDDIDKTFLEKYIIRTGETVNIDSPAIIADLYRKVKNKEKNVSLYFHELLTELIMYTVKCICKDSVKQIALSGGTWYNQIVLSRVMIGLKKAGYSVYINEKVPSGDGGLSLGQAWVAVMKIKKEGL